MGWITKLLGLDYDEKPSSLTQSAVEYGNQKIYEFIANLSINTPLKYLEMDGKRVVGREPRSKPAEYSYGLWIEIVPKDKHSEVKNNDTLERKKVYIGFRKIVESKLTPPERLKALEEFVADDPEFTRTSEEITNWLDGYAGFWEAFDMECLSARNARCLYEAGFENRRALELATDDEILKVKGIGVKKLARIRQSLKE